MSKRVKFKETPKIKRIVTVSFMSGGKKITYQKNGGCNKQTGKRFFKRKAIYKEEDRKDADP